MKRTRTQLDERTYGVLRRRAFEKRRSISSVIRELLAQSLGTGKAKQRLSIKDFTSAVAGRSRQACLAPVSERHDQMLKEALLERHR